MDCIPPGSSVHGVFQARILEWVAISFSRGSSLPWNRTQVSCGSYIGRQTFYHWATWEDPSFTYPISFHLRLWCRCGWGKHNLEIHLTHQVNSVNLPRCPICLATETWSLTVSLSVELRWGLGTRKSILAIGLGWKLDCAFQLISQTLEVQIIAKAELIFLGSHNFHNLTKKKLLSCIIVNYHKL